MFSGKLFTFMPAVENQNAVVSRSYGSAGEMFVRRVGVADREHPFCSRGSEKADAAGGRKRPAGGCSCAPTAVTAFPPIPPSSWNRSPSLVGPCRIFVLKILTDPGLRLKRTRRNVTEAQPPPDGFLPWNTRRRSSSCSLRLEHASEPARQFPGLSPATFNWPSKTFRPDFGRLFSPPSSL